jgi:hypothetical protein
MGVVYGLRAVYIVDTGLWPKESYRVASMGCGVMPKRDSGAAFQENNSPS